MEPLQPVDMPDNCREWTRNGTSVWSIGPDTWIVLYENQSSEGELLSPVSRDSLLTYGAFLSVWSLVIGLTVVVLLLKTVTSALRRFPAVVFLCTQVLLGALVVPLLVLTQYRRRWPLGRRCCHAWLAGQVLLLAVSGWSLLAATAGQLLAARWPQHCQKRGWMISLGLSVSSIAVGAGATVLPALLLQKEGAVLEEVCAVTMTRRYALAVSVSTFLLPAACQVALAVVLLLYHICSGKHNDRARYVIYKKPDCQKCSNKTIFHESPRKGYQQCPTAREAGGHDVTAVQRGGGVVAVAGLLYVALWTPFHAANLLVSSCQGFCLHPSLWSLFIWLGYSSAGLMPLVFLFSREVRTALKMNVCRACAV